MTEIRLGGGATSAGSGRFGDEAAEQEGWEGATVSSFTGFASSSGSESANPALLELELEANTIADALAALTLAARNRRRTATAAATIKTTANAVATNAAGVAAEIVTNYCS